MPDEIPFIPEIPSGIQSAMTRGTLVPFIGAGVSLLAGCPSWGQFADNALRELVNKGLTWAQWELLQSRPPRTKLSIALGICQATNVALDYAKLLEPKDGYQNAMGRRIYGALAKMANTSVTTNYDSWLDIDLSAPAVVILPSQPASTLPVAPGRAVYDEVKDFTAEHLNSPGVFHIHGSLRRPSGMIITMADYLRHYANDRRTKDAKDENRLLSFLENLFEKKNVLFLGYGLEEAEILEYIVQKARRPSGAAQVETKHYMLQGFFSHEIEVFRAMQPYYRAFGIELIAFNRDRNNWEQLAEVLDNWSQKILARDPMVAQELSEMETLLDA